MTIEEHLRGVRSNRQLPRRILGGAAQPPVPAENSIEFGAAISEFRFPNRRLSHATHWRIQLNSVRRFWILDFRLEYRARDPLENSMEIWRSELVNCRGEFGAVISIPGRFPFDLGFDFNLKKN